MSQFSVHNNINNIPEEVINLIKESLKLEGFLVLLESLFKSYRIIGSSLRDCDYTSNNVGSCNEFGDKQLDIDVKSDEVIFNCLKDTKLVFIASSEENPTSISCGGSNYCVAFDPLDGSSIVDANFAVGTIVGIWKGTTLLNRTGREQICSMISMYGPKVTLALALNKDVTVNGEAITLELTMYPNHWEVSIPKLNIRTNGKTFAPGNLRATFDNPQYKALVEYWIENKYTLRYSGGLVPDVYHILIKGEGVFSNASSKSARAKLRLLYEAAPIALIIEGAGGSSCVCSSEALEVIEPISLLDVVITHLDRRVGVCYGSTEEVDRFRNYLFNT